MSAHEMNDKFWDDVAPDLQRAMDLRPLTQKQAKKAYDEAPEAQITDDEIEQLLRSSRLDIPQEACFDASDSMTHGDSHVARDVCEIHRNEGDSKDPEVDELLDQQRREALEDDVESERDDEPEAS